MLSPATIAPRAIRDMLQGQPLTAAKVRFAWNVTVGSAMARATTVDLGPKGTILVRAGSDHWRRETLRSAGAIRQRLAELLGREAVQRVVVTGPKERG